MRKGPFSRRTEVSEEALIAVVAFNKYLSKTSYVSGAVWVDTQSIEPSKNAFRLWSAGAQISGLSSQVILSGGRPHFTLALTFRVLTLMLWDSIPDGQLPKELCHQG